MRKWKQQISTKKYGVCNVVEHTDRECSSSRNKGVHLAPSSHGFVNLYKDGKFVAWCGIFYAEKHLVEIK